MDQHPRPAPGSRPGADLAEAAAARAVVRDAILHLRPLVTQSRDGLTLVFLARAGRRPARRRADRLLGSRVASRVADCATLEVRDADAADLAAVTSAFVPPPDADAVAVGLFDCIVSLDAFDDPAVLASAWPRLLGGAAAAWLERRRAIRGRLVAPPLRSHPDDGAVRRLLRRAVAAVDDAVARPSVGAGATRPSVDDAVDVRFVGDRVHGSALVVHGRAVHVSLLRREPPAPPDRLVL